jgi:hypothetical protein
VLWPRLRIRRLWIRLLGIWRLRILRNRALDVLAGTVLARPWLLLSVGGLWLWMFGRMRLSAFAVRLRTLRGRAMRLAVRIVLWPVLLQSILRSDLRGPMRRWLRFGLWSALCSLLRRPLRFAVRTVWMPAVWRQLLRWPRVRTGMRPLRSRSVRGRMLRPRRLRQLPSELRRDTESLRTGLLSDLRDRSCVPPRFDQPVRLSARYWTGGADPWSSVDTDSQAALFAAGR